MLLFYEGMGFDALKSRLLDTSCQLCFAGCGVSVVKQQGAQRRIVGGDEAGFGSFPWQVRCSFMYFNYDSKSNPGFRVLHQSVGFCN